jgi:hypothetical protein
MTTDQFRTKIREITNTTTNDYSDASLIRDLNSELSMVQIGILVDRGTLEFDDVNYTDLPETTFTIVAGTRNYKITTDDNSNKLLTIHKVSVLNGTTYEDVPRITLGEGNQAALNETGSALVPTGYYELGNNIVFKESPSSGGTGRIQFDRELSFVGTGDTTKVPGIPDIYHNLVAYRVGQNYALDKNLVSLDRIQRRVNIEEERLHLFEETRRGDESVVMSVSSPVGL